jgi:hypothetical protein
VYWHLVCNQSVNMWSDQNLQMYLCHSCFRTYIIDDLFTIKLLWFFLLSWYSMQARRWLRSCRLPDVAMQSPDGELQSSAVASSPSWKGKVLPSVEGAGKAMVLWSARALCSVSESVVQGGDDAARRRRSRRCRRKMFPFFEGWCYGREGRAHGTSKFIDKRTKEND